MAEPGAAKPEPVCPECGLSLTRPARALIDVREAFGRIQRSLREQPERDRKYAVGYGWSAEAVCVNRLAKAPDLERIVVAVDPRQASEETGIIVAGRDADGDCYVLADYSRAMTPDAAAWAAIDAYRRHAAGEIAAAINLVGGYFEALLYRTRQSRPEEDRKPDLIFKGVTAMKGYLERFKPVKALYEQGAAHHVGAFPELEERMFAWMPGDHKPMGRIEALIVALTELTGNCS